jgi:ABC-2 type transport system permease protein
MRSFWLVAKHEYRRTVIRRGFIIATLAIPLGMALLIGLAILVEIRGESDLPIGYVDLSGSLDASRQAALPDADKRVQVRAFVDEAAATAALESEEIQAYFVLPADYPESLHTQLYYLEEPPSDDAWQDFDDFVRLNLLASQPARLQQRLLEGADVTVHDTASNREFGRGSMVNIILPFVATFFFFFATMMTAARMLDVVAGEKENRTMEVMLTSLTPGQLIGGKMIGLLAAALTQLGIYVGAALLALLIAAPHVPEVQQMTVPWGYLALMAIFFLPAYALISALMVAIGAAVTEVQQGQQVAAILNLLFILPVFFQPLIFNDPAHPLLVFLTLFPTTSFLTISLRWGLGSIPQWQIGLSWILMVSSTLFAVWAAARIFRAGMLRYGQPLSPKAVVAAVRGPSSR